MKIAKIVSSNSHIDYAARIIDELDADSPPGPDDYGFGQFVSIPAGDSSIVGIIYDSKLLNPDYGHFGPRLSPRPALGNFTPDYLNEQGVLIGILLLGSVDSEGSVNHGVPRRIVPPGQDVERLADRSLRAFHIDKNDRVHLHYYAQVVAHAGPFAVPLLDSIIDQLCIDCSDAERQRLLVLKQSLMWQGTMGGMKL